MNYIRKYHLEIIIVFIFVLVFLFIIMLKPLVVKKEEYNNIEKESISYIKESTESSYEATTITVYISGDVYNPGVKILPKGSLFKTLYIVSRPKNFIDPRKYNMSEKLINGRHYYLKSTSENGSSLTININEADVETLKYLDGIGEVKAKMIVEYRTKNGYFTSLDMFFSLLKGVSSENLLKIKTKVTI